MKINTSTVNCTPSVPFIRHESNYNAFKLIKWFGGTAKYEQFLIFRVMKVVLCHMIYNWYICHIIITKIIITITKTFFIIVIAMKNAKSTT